MKIRKISKLLSRVLRHKPQSIGIELDPGGWADIDTLLERLEAVGHHISRDDLELVVRENDKQRFDIVADRIRANQGHSIHVELGLEPVEPPSHLFHGTATRFLQAIKAEGLKKMSRQQVHLSPDQQTATRVGSRHGQPVILRVDSLRMHEDGFKYYQAKNGVWLVDSVPWTYLEELPSTSSRSLDDSTVCRPTSTANPVLFRFMLS